MTMPSDLPDPLVLKFASTRPDEMAGLLANSVASDLSEFFAMLPAQTAAGVAARLPSWQLTGLLGNLEPQLVSGMLLKGATDDAVAIVSHLHESRYQPILDASAPRERSVLAQLFDFPSHSLAALVTTRFIRVIADTPCSAFCEQLSSNSDTRPRPVLVVDGKGKYQGLLNLQAVYSRKNRTKTVAEIADPVEPLMGQTDAATALDSRLWMRFTELPVVDKRHRVLGVISRAALLRVVGEGVPREFTLERMFLELAGGYLNTCSRLLESLLGKTR